MKTIILPSRPQEAEDVVAALGREKLAIDAVPGLPTLLHDAEARWCVLVRQDTYQIVALENPDISAMLSGVPRFSTRMLEEGFAADELEDPPPRWHEEAVGYDYARCQF